MKNVISDLDIAESFEEVKKMKKSNFESLVNKKEKAEAFKEEEENQNKRIFNKLWKQFRNAKLP